MAENRSAPVARTLAPAILARLFHSPALVYFNAVAEHLSVREASRRLNVASSAVARQVTQLETSLGLELFLREARRLKLTPAGEILFHHTRGLRGQLEAAVSELDLLRGLKSGTVRLATVESVGLTVLPNLIAAFTAKFPRLHIDVRMAPANAVLEMIQAEEVDIGFAFAARTAKGIDVAVRRDLPIGVAVHPNHPLAQIERPTLGDCRSHLLALARPGISIREMIQPLLDRDAQPRRAYLETDSIRMLLELAKTGAYAAIVTSLGLDRELAEGSLVFRPIEERGLVPNRFVMATKAGRSLRFAPAAFFDHAKRHFVEPTALG